MTRFPCSSICYDMYYYMCHINCPSNACNPEVVVAAYRRVVVLQGLCVSSGLKAGNTGVDLVDVARRHSHTSFGQRINQLNSHRKRNVHIAGHSLTLQVDTEGVRHEGEPPLVRSRLHVRNTNHDTSSQSSTAFFLLNFLFWQNMALLPSLGLRQLAWWDIWKKDATINEVVSPPSSSFIRCDNKSGFSSLYCYTLIGFQRVTVQLTSTL